VTSRRLFLVSLAAASGMLLFLSNYPLHLWPVQAVALVPLWVGLLRLARSTLDAVLAGLVTAIVNLLPLSVMLEFPLLMAAGLLLYLALLWTLLVVGVHQVIRAPAPLGALGAGAVAVLVEWADFNLAPVWGTAQSFARVWSAGPQAIQIVSAGGMLALVFVLVALQVLVASLLVVPTHRRRSALSLLLLLGAVGLHAYLVWPRNVAGHLRVAAMGWTDDHMPRDAMARLDRVFLPLARKAMDAGARIIVSPEVGLWLDPLEREAVMARLSTLARQHRVMLAVGYFNRQRNDNRIAFVDEQGDLVGEYVKTHLIPFVEHYQAGSGVRITLAGPRIAKAERMGSDRVRLGGMICQDDNFTDVARGYGRDGAQIVVVPTNDWRQVRHYHFENSIFRGVENRYGVIRAASNGISAIIAPSGQVLARSDHFKDGPGVIVADMPVVPAGTPYSRAGDVIVVVCLIGLIGGVVLFRMRRRRARNT